MNENQLFELIPLWVIYCCSVAVVMLCVKIGIWIIHLHKEHYGHEQDPPVGAVVGATLGLLAFMLAFTFGIAASRFDTRKQLLLKEVNTIGTTFLRAGFFPEPHCTEIRKLLGKYVDIRASAALHPENIPQLIKDSEEVQDELWQHAVVIAKMDLNSDIGALFAESLNEMIDLHTERVTVGLYRIPLAIWVALCIVTILSMVEVGYHFGRFGKGNWLVILALSLAFSAVIWLIVDLDRPSSGSIKVSQQPMVELQNKLEEQMKKPVHTATDGASIKSTGAAEFNDPGGK